MMKKLINQNILLPLSLLSIIYSSVADASYYGRFTSGGFFSKEIFRSDNSSNRYNDVSVLSQRLFLSIDKIQNSSSEFSADIRDKHDFFDKLDAERMKLTSSNKLQVHQLSLHTAGDSEGGTYSFGRFPLSDAGSLFVDGADIGFRKSILGLSVHTSLFYGLNPSDPEESELKLNTKARAYGFYGVIENKDRDWDHYFYSSNAIVRQTYNSDVDRFYFFNNTVWQKSVNENFSNLLYLDLNPKISVQNLWTSYYLNFSNSYKLRSTLSTIDSLHYQRIQDLREILPSSRYHQASFSLRSPSNGDQVIWENKLSYGKRLIDDKNRIEYKIGAFLPRFLKDDLSANTFAGVRKNFVSKDALFGFGIIHSNNQREIAFNQEIDLEQRTNLNNIAFITDGSYTKFFDRSLFGILSLQNTWDKNVSIFSILFKISYRFGEGGQAPIRDGSPPMGQL